MTIYYKKHSREYNNNYFKIWISIIKFRSWKIEYFDCENIDKNFDHENIDENFDHENIDENFDHENIDEIIDHENIDEIIDH
jgi:hypothetical protein